jgi:hypothetical protein
MKSLSLFPDEEQSKEPLKFTNKWGNIFYIKARKTKTGKTTFVITKTLSKDCISKLPDSYEVVEIPTSGQFVVRKKEPTQYTDQEIKVIEDEVKRIKDLHDYKLDIRGNTLSIFVKMEFDTSAATENSSLLLIAKGMVEKMKNYEELMRIQLEIIGKEREYTFQRYNFLGRFDDWMDIGYGDDLEEMAKKYIPHIGQDSYYELY